MSIDRRLSRVESLLARKRQQASPYRSECERAGDVAELCRRVCERCAYPEKREWYTPDDLSFVPQIQDPETRAYYAQREEHYRERRDHFRQSTDELEAAEFITAEIKELEGGN
jgi:hypothetical protein